MARSVERPKKHRIFRNEIAELCARTPPGRTGERACCRVVKVHLKKELHLVEWARIEKGHPPLAKKELVHKTLISLTRKQSLFISHCGAPLHRFPNPCDPSHSDPSTVFTVAPLPHNNVHFIYIYSRGVALVFLPHCIRNPRLCWAQQTTHYFNDKKPAAQKNPYLHGGKERDDAGQVDAPAARRCVQYC